MSSYFNHIAMPLALVTAVGCIDFEISDNKDPVNPLDGPPPCIEVNPGELQFSDVEVAAADSLTEVVTVSNSCDGDLKFVN